MRIWRTHLPSASPLFRRRGAPGDEGALVASLRKLKDCGVSWLISSSPAQQRSAHELFCLPPPVEVGVALGKHSKSSWSRADGYFYRILGQMQLLRATVKTKVGISGDLSDAEVRRMTGQSETLLYAVLQQRESLRTLSEGLMKVTQDTEQLSVLSRDSSTAVSPRSTCTMPTSAKDAQDDFSTKLEGLLYALRQFAVLCDPAVPPLSPVTLAQLSRRNSSRSARSGGTKRGEAGDVR